MRGGAADKHEVVVLDSLESQIHGKKSWGYKILLPRKIESKSFKPKFKG